MALELGELSGRLNLDDKPAQAAANRVHRRMGTLKSQGGKAGEAAGKEMGSKFGRGLTTSVEKHLRATTSRLGGWMKSVAKVGATTFLGLAAAGAGLGLKIAAGNEQAEISFTTMLGSAKKSKSFLTQLQAFAAKTPFEFPELQTAASSLISAGINAKKVIPIMTTLGDVTSGMGTGSEGVQRATIALQQMNAAGRITGEDLNQLRDAGIPVYDLLAKATGKSKAEVVKLAQSGKLGKKELDAMMKALETGKGLERFSGLMDKQSESLTGLWSTLKDTVGQGLATAIKPLIPVIKDGLGGAIKFIGAQAPKAADGVKWLMKHAKDAKPALAAAGRVLKDVFDRVKSINGDDIARVWDKLKDALHQLMPIIHDAGTALPALGPTVQKAGVAFGFLADHVDMVGKVLPYLIAAFAAYKAMQLANNAIGKDSLIGFGLQITATISLALSNRALAKSQQQVAATTLQANTAEKIGLLTRARGVIVTVAMTVAQKAAAIATKAWAIAQRVLNAAMKANPIGIVITVLALLVGALIYAYRHSETFRKIVDKAMHVAGLAFKWLWARAKEAFGWLKKNWGLVLAIITGPIGLAVRWIYRHWDQIKAIFKAGLNWVRNTFRAGWDKLREILMRPVHAGMTLVNNRIDRVRAIFRAILNWISTTWTRGWARIKGWMLNPVEAARKAIDRVIEGVKRIFRDGVTKIGQIWDKLGAVAKKPISFIINTVLNGGLLKAYNWVAGKLGIKSIAPIKIKGFDSGGYTGNRPKHEPVGVVHGDEHVIRSSSRRKFESNHPGWLDFVNKTGRLPGFFLGGRAPVGGGSRRHSGYPWATWAGDFSAGTGTPVHAWNSGRVAAVKNWNYSYGHHVRINHPGNKQTLYAHLRNAIVRVGEAIGRGNVLGYSDSTGNSTGPHLHFELKGGQGVLGGKNGAGALAPIIDYLKKFKDRITSPLKKLSGLGNSPWAKMIKGAGSKLSDGMIEKVKGAMASMQSSSGAGFTSAGGGSNRAIGKRMMLQRWNASNWSALNSLWTRESGWRTTARNPSSGAYGIPQSLPASKMASAGSDWRTNAATQIKWGLGYIASRYGSPKGAWAHSQRTGWYANGVGSAAPGFGWTGEKGAELVVNPQLRSFKGGERVLNAQDTRKMMGGEGARVHQENHFPATMDPRVAAEVAGQRLATTLKANGW